MLLVSTAPVSHDPPCGGAAPNVAPDRVGVSEVQLAGELDVADLFAAPFLHRIRKALNQGVRDEVIASHHDRKRPRAGDLVHGLPQRLRRLLPLHGENFQVAQIDDLYHIRGFHPLAGGYLHDVAIPVEGPGGVAGLQPYGPRGEPGSDF